MKIYKVASLFSGIGGVCLGFKKAGFSMSWANELDPYASTTYTQNFKHPLIVGDIEKIVDPALCDNIQDRDYYQSNLNLIKERQIDILTAGFPCQAFSIAGHRKGFDDKRGILFWSIIKLVNILDSLGKKPRVLFLENVKNLHSHDNGNTYAVIKNEITNNGYFVKEAILNTSEYTDIPQNRERIFIVCFSNKEDYDNFTLFDFDSEGKQSELYSHRVNKTAEDRVKDIEKIIDKDITIYTNPELYYTQSKYPHYFLTEEQYNQINDNLRKAVRINIEEEVTEYNQFYQIRRGMYIRKNRSGICPTLTANMGTGGHNVPLIKVEDGIRKLSQKECFLLQGFPANDEYSFPELYNGKRYPKSYLYKQAGNSVTVDIIKFIASHLLTALEKTDSCEENS